MRFARPATLLAALGTLLAAVPARAWDPFWSEDPDVERGNERFLASAPRDAIDAYRSAALSQRAEVQYDIGLAALALAQSATAAAPPAAEAVPAGPAAPPAADAGTAPPGEADGGTTQPPPATPTDDLSQCLLGVRPSCLRLAASSFARATDSRGDHQLRANAFHSLGNVYLLQAEDQKPPETPAVPELQDKECQDVQAAIQALQQAQAAFDDAVAPLDKAIDQFRSALVERPGDEDSAWNLALALRRKRDLADRKAALEGKIAELQILAAEKCKDQQNQQNQDQQNQDQQNQDQQNQDQQNQDQQQQEQQPQDQQRQREREQQRQRQENGEEQDIQQQLQNLRDQEELFQQMRQREEAQQEEEGIPLQPYQRQAPERDW